MMNMVCEQDVLLEGDRLESRRIEDNVCPECESLLVVTEDGTQTCTGRFCGKTFNDFLDSAPEWKFFNNGEDRHGTDTTRCGNPGNPLLSESSFGLKIMSTHCSSYEVKKFMRYTEWQSMPHREKSLYNEFNFISTVAQNSGIPKIFIDDAMRYHKEISSQKMFRGLNRDGIKAASIYISCRVNENPRTAQEIANIFHLDKTSASKGCSMAVSLLHNVKRNSVKRQRVQEPDGSSAAEAPPPTGKGKKVSCGTRASRSSTLSSIQTSIITLEDVEALQTNISSPTTFIDRFCTKLNVSSNMCHLCKFIAKKIESEFLLGEENTPQSLAAGIVYFVIRLNDIPITKTDIRSVCNVSEVTLTKCARKVDLIREKVVPKMFHSDRKLF
jgi:transcription initiation factor TFIIIB Brf1 subunit/transcription initiation factor TFIIB